MTWMDWLLLALVALCGVLAIRFTRRARKSGKCSQTSRQDPQAHILRDIQKNKTIEKEHSCRECSFMFHIFPAISRRRRAMIFFSILDM